MAVREYVQQRFELDPKNLGVVPVNSAPPKGVDVRHELSYVRYHGGIDTLLNALDADRDLLTATCA